MIGATANLEYTLVEMLANERNQGRLDTGIIVLLVSSVERFGNAVVVYASCHGDACVPCSTRNLRDSKSARTKSGYRRAMINRMDVIAVAATSVQPTRRS